MARRIAALLVLASCLVARAAPPPRYITFREPSGGPGSPLVTVLRDNVAGVEAAVAPSEGGELSSLRVKFRGEWVELIYRARDYSPAPGFRGKAPFLWPAVGAQFQVENPPATACGDGTYLVDGRRYPMPCHGFVKSLPWQKAGQGAGSAEAWVSVELRDSERTRPIYPFGFRLLATYRLSAGRLTITYRVSAAAANAGPMPFSIGNHVALRLPFLPGTDPITMLFETPNTSELMRDSHGLVIGEPRPQPHVFATPTRLRDFDATVALPLIGYQGDPYAILADPQGLALRITHHASSVLPGPLVQFNIYGGPAQGFLCPEPWLGLQNSLNVKQGLVTLAPGADWDWTIEFLPRL